MARRFDQTSVPVHDVARTCSRLEEQGYTIFDVLSDDSRKVMYVVLYYQSTDDSKKSAKSSAK